MLEIIVHATAWRRSQFGAAERRTPKNCFSLTCRRGNMVTFLTLSLMNEQFQSTTDELTSELLLKFRYEVLNMQAYKMIKKSVIR